MIIHDHHGDEALRAAGPLLRPVRRTLTHDRTSTSSDEEEEEREGGGGEVGGGGQEQYRKIYRTVNERPWHELRQ